MKMKPKYPKPKPDYANGVTDTLWHLLGFFIGVIAMGITWMALGV